MKEHTHQKKPAGEDWHWADVMALLRKRGWSLRQIGVEEGYADGNTLGEVARRPYPKAERLLARYLGIEHPKVIWPSRYHLDGTPNRRIGRAPMRGQPPIKATTPMRGRNPQTRACA